MLACDHVLGIPGHILPADRALRSARFTHIARRVVVPDRRPESGRMSVKTWSWILLTAITVGGVVLFNYWASYQLLSTVAYAGIVAALLGVANLAFPFRFLGVRKRVIGVLILAGGVALTIAALVWPASTIRVTQPRSRLDEAMPEYQFFEKHSTRIHARPELVMRAVRESTFGDMKSLRILLKVRGRALRTSADGAGIFLPDKRILDVFSASGYISGASEHEIVMCGGANVRARRGLEVHTLQECADYRQPGTVKVAYNFSAEDAGGGWSLLSTETRIMATDDDTRRGMARYWRLIVPGSGLLRRQWLDGIKRRAERES